MQSIFRSVNYLNPYVEVANNAYRWISLLEGQIHIGKSGPEASVVEFELRTPPSWVVGGTCASRKIGEIDLDTYEYVLNERESLLPGK